MLRRSINEPQSRFINAANHHLDNFMIGIYLNKLSSQLVVMIPPDRVHYVVSPSFFSAHPLSRDTDFIDMAT